MKIDTFINETDSLKSVIFKKSLNVLLVLIVFILPSLIYALIAETLIRLFVPVGTHRFLVTSDYGYFSLTATVQNHDFWMIFALSLIIWSIFIVSTKAFSFEREILKKKMNKLLLFLLIFTTFALTANAQTRTVENDLRDCSQMLEQSMDEASTCAEAKAAVEKELAKSEEATVNASKLAAVRLDEIEALRKTVERLTKIKCSTESWFFGLRKKKTCY